MEKSPLAATKEKGAACETVHRKSPKSSPGDVETVDRGVGPTPLPPSIADCRPYCGISLYTDSRNGLVDHPMGKYCVVIMNVFACRAQWLRGRASDS